MGYGFFAYGGNPGFIIVVRKKDGCKRLELYESKQGEAVRPYAHCECNDVLFFPSGKIFTDYRAQRSVARCTGR